MTKKQIKLGFSRLAVLGFCVSGVLGLFAAMDAESPTLSFLVFAFFFAALPTYAGIRLLG